MFKVSMVDCPIATLKAFYVENIANRHYSLK